MNYLEFGTGDISPYSFTFRQTFHCPPKPPFSWFAQATLWVREITCTSCQGLQEFHCTSCQSLEKFIEWFIWKSDFRFSFFCYCAEVIIKNVDNFLKSLRLFHCLVTKDEFMMKQIVPRISDFWFPSKYFLHYSC